MNIINIIFLICLSYLIILGLAFYKSKHKNINKLSLGLIIVAVLSIIYVSYYIISVIKNISNSIMNFFKSQSQSQEIEKIVPPENRPSPEYVINNLKKNIKEITLANQLDQTTRLVNSEIVFLCCSEQLVPVDEFFNFKTRPYVIKNLGNMINENVIASTEFAVEYGAKVIVVLGHTNCDPVRCAFENKKFEQSNINTLCEQIKKNIDSMEIKPSNSTEAVKGNINKNINNLIQESSLIKDALDSNKIKIIGAVLDIKNGNIEIISGYLD